MHRSIMKDLWQVGGEGLTTSSDAAIYLIRCGDQAALVDAGCGSAPTAVAANIDQCLQDTSRLSHLLLTHCHFDHTGGAEAIRQTYGCLIVAHFIDAAYLEAGDSEVTAASWYGTKMPPLTIDKKLRDPEVPIEIGSRTITAHHWPGHSPGSLVYTTTMEDRVVLFGQDVHGPIHSALLSDPERYQASLQRLLEIDADVLLEGHFGIFEGKKQVRKFIKSFIKK